MTGLDSNWHGAGAWGAACAVKVLDANSIADLQVRGSTNDSRDFCLSEDLLPISLLFCLHRQDLDLQMLWEPHPVCSYKCLAATHQKQP